MLVILGTGGTIAGQAADAADNVGYKAGELAVEQLIQAVPSLSTYPLECEQVAQLDSKDMDFATWQRLARAVAGHLARPEVQGLVITHGTDTLEETAFFLQRLLAPTKPVVLTAAMRPATALLADGPQNLLDAVRVASLPSARGVVTVVGGKVYGPEQVRKVHSYRLDAFASSDGGQLALVEEGMVRLTGAWPASEAALGVASIDRPAELWPRVQIVWNHVGADGCVVDALLAQGVDGIVVAATGNGTLSAGLEAALRRASAQGVAVVIGTRCDSGAVIAAPNTQAPWRTAGALSPVKARIELLLALLEV
jgi:L-asparaginase